LLLAVSGCASTAKSPAAPFFVVNLLLLMQNLRRTLLP
jgi:hypothetical protein